MADLVVHAVGTTILEHVAQIRICGARPILFASTAEVWARIVLRCFRMEEQRGNLLDIRVDIARRSHRVH